MANSSVPQLTSVSELQRSYTIQLRRAKKSGRPLFVLKKNKLEAVLLSRPLFEDLAEKARLYEERQTARAIRAYEKEKKTGKLKKLGSLDELFT